MAKGRKSGGRSKGTPNKPRAKPATKIEDTGLTPLEFLVRVFRGEITDSKGKLVHPSLAERLEAARCAAPYLHARQPQAVNATLDGSVGLTLNINLG